jgi:RimJ/RimL family protein N-acetyltransferase
VLIVKEAPLELATDRLTLRIPQPDDMPDMCRMWADPEVVTFIGGRPFTTEEVWHRLLRYRGLWATLGYGYWVIEEKGTGDFVGEIGFADWKREGIGELDGLPECGWVLLPAKQGRGYATEALAAALRWFDTYLPGMVAACIISPPNTRSITLAKAHGFEPVRDLTYKGSETRLFFRSR